MLEGSGGGLPHRERRAWHRVHPHPALHQQTYATELLGLAGGGLDLSHAAMAVGIVIGFFPVALKVADVPGRPADANAAPEEGNSSAHW